MWCTLSRLEHNEREDSFIVGGRVGKGARQEGTGGLFFLRDRQVKSARKCVTIEQELTFYTNISTYAVQNNYIARIREWLHGRYSFSRYFLVYLCTTPLFSWTCIIYRVKMNYYLPIHNSLCTLSTSLYIENFRMEFKMIDTCYRNFIPYIPCNMVKNNY